MFFQFLALTHNSQREKESANPKEIAAPLKLPRLTALILGAFMKVYLTLMETFSTVCSSPYLETLKAGMMNILFSFFYAHNNTSAKVAACNFLVVSQIIFRLTSSV